MKRLGRPLPFAGYFPLKFLVLKNYLLAKYIFVAGAMLISTTAIALSEQADGAIASLCTHPMGNAMVLTGKVSLLMIIMMLGWRIILVLRYRPMPACADHQLPQVSVIVPAYNEGMQVLVTLRSLALSDYPVDRLRIIAVDDGSVDDTWHWILSAATELKGRILPIRLPVNQGKRHALYAGFQQGDAEVFVTVDSDSTVTPDTLRRLVSPFPLDSRVGAVAGNVRVLNLEEGIIPRMLQVIFHFSFDFVRASQSMVNTVMCTPGALSAYRGSVVQAILPQWLGQTFFGRPANIGEDRAMTNLILRQGYHSLFQGDAEVYTKVPTRYRTLCKMFLRWARSNVRESLVMASFLFTPVREGSLLGARINLLYHLASMARSLVVLAATYAAFLWQPMVLGSSILMGALISASLPALLYALRYRSSEALWAYFYAIFWVVALSWIAPYALLTPHKTSWLTRQVKKTTEVPVVQGRPLPLGHVIAG